MGAFTSYSIYSSLFLLSGYLIYKWLMAGEKQLAMNRATLLLIYIVALLALPATELIHNLANEVSTNTSSGEIEIGALDMVSMESTNQSIVWASIIVYTYTAGVIVTTILSLISYIRINRLLSTGRIVEYNDETNLVLLPSGKAAPFSWMNYVAITADDYHNGGDVIIAHELAHIRHRHCLDLILAQAVCTIQWFRVCLIRNVKKTEHQLCHQGYYD